MADKFIVSASPHYRSRRNTRSVMFDVILALCPILAMSVIMYGWRALSLTVVSVGSCAVFESAFNLIRNRKNSVWDLSAVVTGMILAFMLPVTASYLMVIAGSFVAIVLVKMLFGGIGKNFLNPALTARAFIELFSDPVYVNPFSAQKLSVFYDGLLNPSDISHLTAEPLLGSDSLGTRGMFSLLLGDVPGRLGETCVLVIVICGLYLMLRGVITWQVPVSYLGSFALICYLFPVGGGMFSTENMLLQLFGGGVVFAAFFVATDYSTCPLTGKGRLIHGLGCGLLTVLFRYFGAGADGMIYAVLIMNLFAQRLDVLTKPSRYGKGGIRRESQKIPE